MIFEGGVFKTWKDLKSRKLKFRIVGQFEILENIKMELIWGIRTANRTPHYFLQSYTNSKQNMKMGQLRAKKLPSKKQ